MPFSLFVKSSYNFVCETSLTLHLSSIINFSKLILKYSVATVAILIVVTILMVITALFVSGQMLIHSADGTIPTLQPISLTKKKNCFQI